MDKIKPNSSGYWAALQKNGKFRVFEVAVISGDVKVLSKNWRTASQVEESFGLLEWLGKVEPEMFGR